MYKIPPKKSQFQKGKSGNPNGRPKSSDLEFMELTSCFIQAVMEAMKKNRKAKLKLKIIRTKMR